MTVSSALAQALQAIGPPDTLARSAMSGATPRRLNNTHIHVPPNFSAFDSVQQAVGLAAEQGVEVLGVSNYYDYGAYGEFARLARASGVFPLFGTEIICLLDDLVKAGHRINDPANPGKMYLCGKGITRFEPLSPEAARLIDVIRGKDSGRMADMIRRINEVFGSAGFDASLGEQDVKAMVVRRHGCPLEAVYLQERHVAQAFQEALAERLAPDARADLLTRVYGAPPTASVEAAVATQNEIRARVMKAGKPGYVPETFVGYDHARSLILALGGIPCYPTLADGATPLCEFESSPEELVERMQGLGIHCAEFIPDRNAPDVLARYALTMRRAGIVVTAGTEHNTRDLIPIAPACKGGAPVPEDVADLFWEGACVVAAHQYLACHGLTGLVTPSGAPGDANEDADARIRGVAALGASVLNAYRRLALRGATVV